MRTLSAAWLLAFAAVSATSAAAAAQGQARRRVHPKVSHRVERLAARDPKGMVDVIIRFNGRPGASERLFLRGLGARERHVYRSSRWIAVRLPARAL
ncbi:MAG TPA: hypothetical protein VMX54_04020, partial [Vicinamibacteria bacterium]|nr:hypothetical protein [Vicinamibacteria bacterium]